MIKAFPIPVSTEVQHVVVRSGVSFAALTPQYGTNQKKIMQLAIGSMLEVYVDGSLVYGTPFSLPYEYEDMRFEDAWNADYKMELLSVRPSPLVLLPFTCPNVH